VVFDTELHVREPDLDSLLVSRLRARVPDAILRAAIRQTNSLAALCCRVTNVAWHTTGCRQKDARRRRIAAARTPSRRSKRRWF